MSSVHEVAFEKEIAEYLAAHGWLYNDSRPFDAGYDRARALYPEDIFGWLQDTQPDELAKVVKPGASETEARKARDALLDRIVKQLDTPLDHGGGTLNVLRGTVKHIAAKFSMCEFKPATTLNETVMQRYAKVRVRVMRQVRYSTKHGNSIDLVLFVNGLPVATAELKTDNTQGIDDAIDQYRSGRLPAGEPLLGFGTRALVHFAVSNGEVFMTTRLAGKDTFFLPFNMGDDGGAGNPPNPHGSATSYLWERVLERDSWLNIIGRLMHLQTRVAHDETGRRTTKSTLLFPRFHQWEAVTKLLATARAEGPGHKYLIQHSAGSGKTNSIAWTAHGLARLFDGDNNRVFDSVIVVTDRNVLDAQLQEAVSQLEPRKGMVVQVTSQEAQRELAPDAESRAKSAWLAKALTDGRDIIVVTIQTFPFAMKAIRESKGLRDKRFAIIADEAHSSQTGSTSSKLKAVLSAQELAEVEDGGGIDTEAVLQAEMADRAEAPNISYFAFTATPKPTTLENFGRKDADGLPVPFHTYTMQQAIEEGFILDVLRNYTPYETAFLISTNTELGARTVDQGQASTALLRWVKLHPTSVAQRVAIIVEHFRENVAGLLGGRAKAMVVCDSRKAAVKYKRAFDSYIADQGYTGLNALVAFSGDDVPDMDPVDGPGPFNERTLNPGLGGRDIRTAFDIDEYQILLVANKFQTGFDQPLLCAMYVDKRLSGVTAVQTLSRLNRTHRVTVDGVTHLKDTTYVLDFVESNPGEVLTAFQRYYQQAALTATTDPNLIHDVAAKLDVSGLYTDDEVVAVSDAVITDAGNSAVDAAIRPVARRFLTRFADASATDDKTEIDTLQLFRKDAQGFVSLYDFLSQIINYADTDLERRSIFFRILLSRIQTGGTGTPLDTSGLSLDRFKTTKGHDVDMTLAGGGDDDANRLRPFGALGSGSVRDPKYSKLEEVVKRLNELFYDESFAEHHLKSFLIDIVHGMQANITLVQQVRANSETQFLSSPDLESAVEAIVMDHEQTVGKVADIFYGNEKVKMEFIDMVGRVFRLFELDNEVPA